MGANATDPDAPFSRGSRFSGRCAALAARELNAPTPGRTRLEAGDD
jgi:hypothetical protein